MNDLPLSFGDWLRRQPRRLCNFGIHSWEKSAAQWQYTQCPRCGSIRRNPDDEAP